MNYKVLAGGIIPSYHKKGQFKKKQLKYIKIVHFHFISQMFFRRIDSEKNDEIGKLSIVFVLFPISIDVYFEDFCREKNMGV